MNKIFKTFLAASVAFLAVACNLDQVSDIYTAEGNEPSMLYTVYSETELTKDTVKQWLSDHGFELVYYTDPTPITLTPASLSTLKGQNNVWSDAGDVTLEYPYYEETEGY